MRVSFDIRIPSAASIRVEFARTGSVRLTAARCGVPMDFVADAVTVVQE